MAYFGSSEATHRCHTPSFVVVAFGGGEPGMNVLAGTT